MNLKSLRTKKGVSQQKLAEFLGLSQQTINKYENHGIEPDIYILCRMADYFGTTIDYLVGHTPEECGGMQYRLNADESILIEQYRTLSPKERDSIRLIIENYLK